MKRTLSILLAMLTLSIPAYAEADASLTLFAVNVGKADALILSAGQDVYLIDSGTAESWGALSSALKTLQIDHLTGVILTHTHDDHAGGLWPLATSSIQVDGWYASAYFTGVKAKKHPAVLAADLRGKAVTWLRAGDVLPLGDGKLSVLGPMSESDTENCNSLVLLAEGGGGRMLLTGDMEFPEENELLSAQVIPAVQVLKVGNHGNKDATSEALARQVKAEIAVISTDPAVDTDTPAPRVMQALRTFGATIYQTQHATAGVLVTIQNGKAQASLMDYDPFPAMPEGIRLSDPDPKNDEIVIRNEGRAEVDLSGWYLHSDRGNEMFVLPAGTILRAGETLRVTTLSSDDSGDLCWPEEKVWHKSKEDNAFLYDVYGRLAAESK